MFVVKKFVFGTNLGIIFEVLMLNFVIAENFNNSTCKGEINKMKSTNYP